MSRKIKMRPEYLAVQLLGKAEDQGGTFVMPEDGHNLGKIKYISDALKEVTDLREGDKIYFGNVREQIMMEGVDVIVMKLDNVYAVEE